MKNLKLRLAAALSCPYAIPKIILFVLLSCVYKAGAQDHRMQKVDSLFTALFNKQEFNGNVLIAEKGYILYQKSFGLRDEAQNLPLDDNSIFELASVSKQFTAMGIVLLEQKGKLKYDDPISKYIPELSSYKGITIRQLLNHTGGLPDYMQLIGTKGDTTKINTNKDIIALFAKEKPQPFLLLAVSLNTAIPDMHCWLRSSKRPLENPMQYSLPIIFLSPSKWKIHLCTTAGLTQKKLRTMPTGMCIMPAEKKFCPITTPTIIM